MYTVSKKLKNRNFIFEKSLRNSFVKFGGLGGMYTVSKKLKNGNFIFEKSLRNSFVIVGSRNFNYPKK